MRRFRLILFLAAVASLVIVGSSGATGGIVITVPLDYATIQEAIDAADDCDTVLVEAGTYSGPGNYDLNYFGKDIVVVSEQGPDFTTIDLQEEGRGFFFETGEPPTAVLEGFTIIRGDATTHGVAILIDNSSPTIRNCIIREHIVDSEFNGVVVIESGDPVFDHCTMEENLPNTLNCGVVWINNGAPVFDECSVINNYALEYTVVMLGGNPDFLQTIVTGNDAPVAAVVVGTDAQFTACAINYNTGHGMWLIGGAPPSFVNYTNIIGNQGAGVVVGANSTEFVGGYIQLNQASGIVHVVSGGTQAQAPLLKSSGQSSAAVTATTFTNVVISGNVNTTSSGGGVRFDCATTPVEDLQVSYVNCTITGNSSSVDGGGVAICGAAVFADILPTFLGCTIALNSAGGQGGGIYSDVAVGGAAVFIVCDQTILYDNCAGAEGSEAYIGDDNYLYIDCSDVNDVGLSGTGLFDINNVTNGTPDFCLPPACLAGGTTGGDFDLYTSSAAAPENNSCNMLIGANPVVCVAVGIGDVPDAPEEDVLWPPSPNPFNPSTTIRFDVAKAGHVTLAIYDVRGRRVRSLIDANVPPSRHELRWDGTDDGGRPVASGIYFLRIDLPESSQTQKLVLVK